MKIPFLKNPDEKSFNRNNHAAFRGAHGHSARHCANCAKRDPVDYGHSGPETTEQVVVTSQELDVSREAIVPSLGATRYTVGPDRLDS